MDDFERRRIQNREAQRRFRQRHNKRKAVNRAVQTFISETSIDQLYRQEGTSNTPSSGELVAPSSTAATTTCSPHTAGFEYGMGIYSSNLFDNIDFTSTDDRSCVPDEDPTFPTSPSSLLQVSLTDTSSDQNTDQILRNLVTSTHNSESSATTRSKSVDSNVGPSNEKGSSAHECVSLTAGCRNRAMSATSESSMKAGEKPGGGWQNPLHIAAAKGHDRITLVLLRHNVDCNEKDSDGLTPLIHATIGGYEDVVGSLLSHGAAVSNVDSKYHRSALHWAVVHRRESLLRILLDHCVAQQTVIDIYDKDGKTPLHTAVDTGYDAGVQMLLQFGANVLYRTRKRKPSFSLE